MLVVAVYAPCDKMRIERVHQNYEIEKNKCTKNVYSL